MNRTELLTTLDRQRPSPIRRSGSRLPGSRERSLELEGVVEVEGGVFLPIAGFTRTRQSSRPTLILIVGGVVMLLGNGAILAGGFGSFLYNGIATVGIMSPFIGWSYKVRAGEARLGEAGGSAPGILVLADEVTLHYPDRDVSMSPTEIRSVLHRKVESQAGTGEHMIITHELVIATATQTHVAWRLVQYSGNPDSDLDTAAALMPAIADWLGRRLGLRGA